MKFIFQPSIFGAKMLVSGRVDFWRAPNFWDTNWDWRPGFLIFEINSNIYIYKNITNYNPHWAHSIPLNSGLHAHSLNHLLRPCLKVAPKKARWVWEAVVWNTVVRCLFQEYGCQPKNNGKFMEIPPKSSHFVHRVGFPWNFHHPFWGVFPPYFWKHPYFFIT